MCLTLLKDMEMSAVKRIAKNRPVVIWMTSLRPRSDPKFHQQETLVCC